MLTSDSSPGCRPVGVVLARRTLIRFALGCCFAFGTLAAQSPLSNADLSRELDDVFDAIQAERTDKIEYIDRYEFSADYAVDAEGQKLTTATAASNHWYVAVRFYIKTRRGAEENFLLSVWLKREQRQWQRRRREVSDLVQTKAPVIRPAKASLPAKQLVFDLVTNRLHKISTPERKYIVHHIEKKGDPLFQWANNYTTSQFEVPLQVKLTVQGRVEKDKNYYDCFWQSRIEYADAKAQWILVDLNSGDSKQEISRSCTRLEQTFLEKVNNLFPGDPQR
ncbi:MAG: hypothetical protein KDK39_14085 [Leptospiraceae bacterium]|nr:hypothetical protein [Leptospiraceae bacterium]